MQIHRSRDKALGLPELVAIALGGMIGGGIFTVLGIASNMVGFMAPVAISMGGIVALLAAYSYVRLGQYYLDQGGSYAYVKRTFPAKLKWASLLGWYMTVGYISTLALYGYTFSSYLLSSTSLAGNVSVRRGLAISIIWAFCIVNIISVKGMGKIEDLMVYAKVVILAVISVLLIHHGGSISNYLSLASEDAKHTTFLSLAVVASLTFVAYEGFQLVLNAAKESTNPKKNTARAIYTAIFLAILIYVGLTIAALIAIPINELISAQESALASGTREAIGPTAGMVVVFGALLATSSAISATVFGSSRQMTSIATDGFFPKSLTKLKRGIPTRAILVMGYFASLMVVSGGLETILEFGSITFILSSIIISFTNYKIYQKTKSSRLITIVAILSLTASGCLILKSQYDQNPHKMLFIIGLYALIAIISVLYHRHKDY